MTDPLSKRRLKMWIRLLGVTRAAQSQLREFLRVQHDTTLPRFDVMAALYRRRDGVTMTELSRMLLVSNGNATTVVDRLENDGLVLLSPGAPSFPRYKDYVERGRHFAKVAGFDPESISSIAGLGVS